MAATPTAISKFILKKRAVINNDVIIVQEHMRQATKYLNVYRPHTPEVKRILRLKRCIPKMALNFLKLLNRTCPADEKDSSNRC